MPKIEHCSKPLRTKLYWLEPEHEHHDFDILLEAECPTCGKTVHEYCYFTYEYGYTVPDKIRHKKLPGWLRRKHTDLVRITEPQQKPDNLRETRGKPHISEFTENIDGGDMEHLAQYLRQLRPHLVFDDYKKMIQAARREWKARATVYPKVAS